MTSQPHRALVRSFTCTLVQGSFFPRREPTRCASFNLSPRDALRIPCSANKYADGLSKPRVEVILPGRRYPTIAPEPAHAVCERKLLEVEVGVGSGLEGEVAALHRQGDSLGSIARAQFGQDGADVKFHRADRDVQLRRDFPIRQAGAQ